MKTIRKLNIKDWSGYFFIEMININNIDHECALINDFQDCKDGSVLFNIAYFEEDSVPHVVFNDIECIFKKSGVFSYLIFCESKGNKEMLDNYTEIVDKIKEEILYLTVDDNLVFNQKINISIGVISLSCVVKRGEVYYPQFKLQDCFYIRN